MIIQEINSSHIPLIQSKRSGITEVTHRGSAVIIQDGCLVRVLGSAQIITPIRSTAKPFQIIPLLKADGQNRFNLSLAEIAVMVSSHNGENEHVNLIRQILFKGGIDEKELHCGTHPPYYPWILKEIYDNTGSEPQPIHNNCSGKHTGMLLLAKCLGVSSESYWQISHPVQQLIIEEIEQLTETPLSIGIDGCGVPTFNISLEELARLYYILGQESSLENRSQLSLVKKAMQANPFMVAGCKRLDTDLMLQTNMIAKSGADGIYCISVPSKSIGIAIKMESGSEEASEAVAVELLWQEGHIDAEMIQIFDQYRYRPIITWTNEIVGTYQPLF